MTTTDPILRHAEQKRAYEERNIDMRRFNFRARRIAWGWLRSANAELYAQLYEAEPEVKPDGTPLHRRARFEKANGALVRCVPKREWLLLYERAKRELAAEEGIEL